MDRNVPPDRQSAGTAVAAAVLGSTLFLPGRTIVAPGMTKGGGEKRTPFAEKLALMPQFLEPLGLRVIDDIDEESDDER